MSIAPAQRPTYASRLIARCSHGQGHDLLGWPDGLLDVTHKLLQSEVLPIIHNNRHIWQSRGGNPHGFVHVRRNQEQPLVRRRSGRPRGADEGLEVERELSCQHDAWGHGAALLPGGDGLDLGSACAAG